ncbi:mechanosensitive ion channel [Mucilaginibacter sp. ZT4R22]|uniref:Mechanosensitive ion channel n=1 Tax=Mucilaginibacter pankratovii TaxID=2772110 RepID=A0ABR7WJZ6_9SPHI|nr:mechanosensitive ion channel domain-containing protein [Mucilaginibacter pankratovii]MBD1362637.1 mechanosensitive ion channel [Mucilaginibacter pankratovii]
MYIHKILIRAALVFPLLTAHFHGYSQAKSTSDTLVADSKIAYVKKMQQIGLAEAARSIVKFKIEQTSLKQKRLLDEISKTAGRANIYLRTGIDTTGTSEEIKRIERWILLAGDGIFTNRGSAQTYRNLNSTSKILHEFSNRLTVRKKQIDKFEQDLFSLNAEIDSLSADPVLYAFSNDSLQIADYIQQIKIISPDLSSAEQRLPVAIGNVHRLQYRINIIVNQLNLQLKQIEDYQTELSHRYWDREFTNLGDVIGFNRPISEIIHYSLIKAILNLRFYTQNNIGKLLLLFFLCGLVTFFLRSLKHLVSGDEEESEAFKQVLVLKHPFLSSIVIVLSFGQFIFIDSPFIFSCFFWLPSALALAYIFRGFITTPWLKMWLIFVALFTFCCIDNLLLQASRGERWFMIFISLIGIVASLLYLFKGRRDELREKLILYFIAFAAILELGSIIGNIFGRYNLAKTLLLTGYLNVVIGILFLWTIRLINEGLQVASKTYSRPDKKTLYLNFHLVGEKSSPLLYILLVLGWFILLGRNFYVFRFIAEPVKGFFTNERTIGSYTFTIINILTFFFIVAFSVLLSKVVSYFASDTPSSHANNKKRNAGIGSWLLLIRVTIISIGLFFGLAAAGFPLERITLIVGALGVGIGFGLQTLVNNLVSGLIIAFEKPVNVGDIVEIGGQSGTMKSIGFRSSIISKWDGPDVVIPNGDLLNEHLINWTLAGNKRQMEIVVGVAYGSDLDRTKVIINELLSKEERILEHPSPAIQFLGFGESSIDIKIFFWVRDFRDGGNVRSNIIAAINKAFSEAGIEIPFPQQHIHFDTPVVTPDEGNLPTKK